MPSEPSSVDPETTGSKPRQPSTRQRKVRRRRRVAGEDSEEELEREAISDSGLSSLGSDSDSQSEAEEERNGAVTGAESAQDKAPEKSDVVVSDAPPVPETSKLEPSSNDWADIVNQTEQMRISSEDVPVVDFENLDELTKPEEVKPKETPVKSAKKSKKKKAPKGANAETSGLASKDTNDSPAPSQSKSKVANAGPSQKDSPDPSAAPTPTPTRPSRPNPRQAYLEKLSSDPSFIPRVGKFWGHDDRLMDKDLRSMSPWWRGRGRGRGRGATGRGGWRGRGGAPHESSSTGEQQQGSLARPKSPDRWIRGRGALHNGIPSQGRGGGSQFGMRADSFPYEDESTTYGANADSQVVVDEDPWATAEPAPVVNQDFAPWVAPEDTPSGDASNQDPDPWGVPAMTTENGAAASSQEPDPWGEPPMTTETDVSNLEPVPWEVPPMIAEPARKPRKPKPAPASATTSAQDASKPEEAVAAAPVNGPAGSKPSTSNNDASATQDPHVVKALSGLVNGSQNLPIAANSASPSGQAPRSNGADAPPFNPYTHYAPVVIPPGVAVDDRGELYEIATGRAVVLAPTPSQPHVQMQQQQQHPPQPSYFPPTQHPASRHHRGPSFLSAQAPVYSPRFGSGAGPSTATPPLSGTPPIPSTGSSSPSPYPYALPNNSATPSFSPGFPSSIFVPARPSGAISIRAPNSGTPRTSHHNQPPSQSVNRAVLKSPTASKSTNNEAEGTSQHRLLRAAGYNGEDKPQEELYQPYNNGAYFAPSREGEFMGYGANGEAPLDGYGYYPQDQGMAYGNGYGGPQSGYNPYDPQAQQMGHAYGSHAHQGYYSGNPYANNDHQGGYY